MSTISATSDHLFHPLVTQPHKKFIQICRDFSLKYGVTYEVASHNYLGIFTLNKVSKVIRGDDIGLNLSTVAYYCDDKAAMSTLLYKFKVAHIEHQLFLKPANHAHSEHAWQKIENYAKSHGFQVVCKPKMGNSGTDVIATRTAQQLQSAVQSLFDKGYRDFCLCPLYPIKHEYRVVTLNGTPELIFRKVRPHLIGDGLSTLNDLLFRYAIFIGSTTEVFKMFGEMTTPFRLEDIPPQGEVINLTWKHNLCKGASAEIIDIPSPSNSTSSTYAKTSSHGQKRSSSDDLNNRPIKQIRTSDSDTEALAPSVQKIYDLAKKAAKATNVVFASIDIAQMENGELRVMEINKSVSFQHLIEQHGDQGYRLAKKLWEKALCQLLEIPYREIELPPRTTRFTSPKLASQSPPKSPISPLQQKS